MASTSSDESLIASLTITSAYLNRYFSIAILLFGTVGNLLNCLVLSQRSLRSNPCASLFLASSIASLITLISGVAVRLMAGWRADLTDTVEWLCKFRIFVVFESRTVASWLIMLATIDRWLSSSTDVHRRQKSTLKNAQLGVLVVILLSSLVYAQIFYCYEANLINAPLKCYGKTTWCRLLIDSTFGCFSIIIPSLLMFIFGSMTILNIRQVARRRVQPMNVSTVMMTINQSQQRSKKTDHQLCIMLLVQVILLTLFSLPQVIQNLYENITQNDLRTPIQNAINNFAFNLVLLLTYVTNGMPFYIYTLSGGSVFRKALVNVLKQASRKLMYRRV